MEFVEEQVIDNVDSMLPIPTEKLQEIVSGWRCQDGEDSITKLNDLLASSRFQYDDEWFYKLTTNCLQMEINHNSNECKFLCPLLTACCRLFKSSIFKSHPSFADELFQKHCTCVFSCHFGIQENSKTSINELFWQYFEKDFSAEDVVAVELFLEVYCCLQECQDIDFVDKKCGTSLKVIVKKLISMSDGPVNIPVKRVMLQLVNLLIEESGLSDIFPSHFEEFVCEYPNALRSCGDYEFQFSYTEAVFRLSQRYPKRVGPMLACKNSDLLNGLMAIDEKEFDKTCRIFLNKYNSWDNTNLINVFSFPCIATSFGKIPWKKTSTDAANIWLDVNRGSSCISFCCDVSIGSEDEQFVALFLSSTDINRISCMKHNVNLCLKVELLKACAEYPINNYYLYNTMQGNTAVFILEEHVELFDISKALSSVGLELHEYLSQELSFENNLLSESLVKASSANFPLRPLEYTNESRELPPNASYKVSGSQALNCGSSEGGNLNLDSLPALSVAKASVADNVIVFSSQETTPYQGSDKFRLSSSNVNPIKLENINDSAMTNNGKSCQLKKYLKGSNPTNVTHKVSSAIDMVPCHEMSIFQNQMLCSVKNSPLIGRSVQDVPSLGFSNGQGKCSVGISESHNQLEHSAVMNTIAPNIIRDVITPTEDQSADSKKMISIIAEDVGNNSLTSSSSNPIQHQTTDVLDESKQHCSSKKELLLLKNSKKRKRKTKPILGFREMDKVIEISSSEEEFTETKSKRKYKVTEKRRNGYNSSKLAKTRSFPNLTDESTDSEHHEWKFWPPVHSGSVEGRDKGSTKIEDSGKVIGNSCVSSYVKSFKDDNRTNCFHANSEKKIGFQYDFTSEEDGCNLTPKKNVIDASTQCTPSTSAVNSQNNSPIAMPLSCNKSTMCSPGLLSGPSSTVKQTTNKQLFNERSSAASFHFDQSTTFKPFDKHRRRLAFDETSAQPTNTFDAIDPGLKSLSFEQKKWFLDKSNAIREFGEKIQTKFSKQFELSVKQITSIKCIFSELQELWKSQLKSSMEIEEQMITHIDIFMEEFLTNLSKFNLQNHQKLSASLVSNGYDTFLHDMHPMEENVLSNTKSVNDDLVSSVPFAKSDRLARL